MYATCLFCNGALGRNEAIEHFPVGRRLAFDGAKGRLWVVCPTCLRWNLSPLETRWEAIDDAERAYRATKLRVSTDNIGLAKLKEGTELVRIGAPQLPEFAGWRYGEVFKKRYRKAAMAGFAPSIVGLLPQLAHMLPASYVPIVSFVGIVGSLASSAVIIGDRAALRVRSRVWVQDQDQRRLLVRNGQAAWTKIVRHPRDDSWHLRVAHSKSTIPGVFSRLMGRTSAAERNTSYSDVHGPAALRALADILPVANWGGADKKSVDFAVSVVENHAHVVDRLRDGAPLPRTLVRDSQTLEIMHAPTRLALEMMLHEADERRALEGELVQLAERWREAEEIAQIADDMFVTASAQHRLDELSEKRDNRR